MNNKIAVIGSPGGGKSYFSKKLSRLTGIPVYHMDNIFWKPDRTNISRDELTRAIEDIMKRDKWIIDGNYISTIEQRIKGAETIFYLDFSTEQCIEGIKSRVGKQRDDIPWTEETLDEEFYDFVVRFRDEIKPEIESLLQKYADKKVVRFSSRDEMRQYLRELQREG